MDKIFTELELLTYLKDYTTFISYIITNPNEKFDYLFTKMLTDQQRIQFNEIEYYQNMLDISAFFILNKYYSLLKDNFFDFLLDKNIDDIQIPKTIFINNQDSKHFSKKQIISYIRNATNHSNHNKLYKLSKENNNIYIEIKLSKTQPIPFHIKITLKEYSTIMSEIIRANRMDFKEFCVYKPINIKSENLFNELDNIIFKQYIIKTKLEDSTIKILKQLQKENKITNIKEILKKEEVIISENKLTTLQKNCVIEQLNQWKNLLFIKEETILKYVLYKVIPSGKYKLEPLSYLLLINDIYLRNYNNTYNNIVHSMLIEEKKFTNHFFDFFKNSENNEILVRDADNVLQITFSLLISYIFENLITDKEVKIGENIYETERIRNSFVHGKWFLGQKGSYKLFDNSPNDLDELNYKWKASIPFKNILIFVENFYKKYYLEHIKTEENEKFLEIPLFLTYRKESDNVLPSYLTFIKKEKKYVFNLNTDNYENKEFLPWHLYKVVNNILIEVNEQEEQEYFYEELDRTILFNEEIKNIIKNNYKKALSIKNNISFQEELKSDDEAFINCFINNNEIKVFKKENI